MRLRRSIFVLLLAARLEGAEVLGLREAAQRAVAAHPSLGVRQAEATAAQAKVDEARAGKWFRVEYGETFTRSDNPVFVFGALLTQRQFSERNFAIGTLNEPGFLNQFQSQVRMEQTLWDAGRRKQAEAAARAGAAAAQGGVELTRVELVARTARAYMDVQLAKEAVRVAGQAVKSAQEDRARAANLRDAGRATDADVASVDVQLAQMREHLLARESERRLALATLNEAMGAPLDTEYEFTTTLGEAAVPVPAPTERAEVALGRHARQGAEAQLGGAKAAYLPQVVARGAWEADRQRFVTRAGMNWTAELALRWSLFDGGAREARVRQATAQLDAAKASEKAVASRVALEVMQAEEMRRTAAARYAVTEQAVAQAAESLRVVQNRYGAGLATVSELLRAETASLETQLRRLMAAHAVRMAQFGQYVAAGQLTPTSEVLQ